MFLIRRWGDNDWHLWPFTFSFEKYHRIGVVIDSGHDESPGCHLRLYLFWLTILFELPPIVRPWRYYVNLSDREWAKPGDGYWEEFPREYGFSVADGFLQVFLGRQTHDSTTTDNWCAFLPWTQWRHVRHSLYDTAGRHVRTKRQSENWQSFYEAQQTCPSVSFEFNDFDGELIVAKTRIEEREWLFGEGWFKWLSLFRKPKICRSLDIQFSKETGKKKGSWKGGTVGHSIGMLPNELHEAAFRRYCVEHSMTFKNKGGSIVSVAGVIPNIGESNL